MAEALASPDPQRYDPDPRGEPAAREAVARWYEGRGLAVDPDRLFLTPGTSESYAWLFKLLCDPGDAVLVPRPSYPLFEFLAGLEAVAPASYPLRYGRSWRIDEDALRGALRGVPTDSRGAEESGSAGRDPAPGARVRGIVVVNPNNPTGSFITPSERDRLADVAAAHDLAILSDEVFSSFPVDGAR